MKEQRISVVPFHADKIYLAEIDGEPYVPLRPIVENLGTTWSPQRRKLMAASKRWGVITMITPSPGGPQDTLCVPLRKIPAFLMAIEVRRVKPAVRPKLELYQEECDQVLWDYWTKGRAERADLDAATADWPRPVCAIPDPEQLRAARREGAWAAARLIMQCQKKTKGDFLAAIRLANKIIHYRQKGMTKSETAILTGLSASALAAMENELRDCGYTYRRTHETKNIPSVFPMTKAVEEVRS